MTVEPSGKVRVATGVGTQGQGHFTVFAQIVADVLGVDVERRAGRDRRHARVSLGHGHVRQPRRGGGGQRVPCGRGPVRDKILDTREPAARALPKTELELGGGRVDGCAERPTPGSRSASSAGKANPLRGAVRPGTEPGLESTAYFGPDRGSTASGVHAMIVEVDPETAQVEIKRYVVVARLRH